MEWQQNPAKQDCTLFYSCDNNDHILGTRFLVSKRINPLIMDFKPITPTICTLRMRGKCLNYSIVNGHVPTETSDDEGKDRFFEALEKSHNISPKNDTKIVLGNFNGQVATKTVNFSTTDKYSLHILMNDNGSWLIQFAVSRDMIIGSTFYPHNNIHNSTRRSPDGVRFNHIYHLLIDGINVT